MNCVLLLLSTLFASSFACLPGFGAGGAAGGCCSPAQPACGSPCGGAASPAAPAPGAYQAPGSNGYHAVSIGRSRIPVPASSIYGGVPFSSFSSFQQQQLGYPQPQPVHNGYAASNSGSNFQTGSVSGGGAYLAEPVQQVQPLPLLGQPVAYEKTVVVAPTQEEQVLSKVLPASAVLDEQVVEPAAASPNNIVSSIIAQTGYGDDTAVVAPQAVVPQTIQHRQQVVTPHGSSSSSSSSSSASASAEHHQVRVPSASSSVEASERVVPHETVVPVIPVQPLVVPYSLPHTPVVEQRIVETIHTVQPAPVQPAPAVVQQVSLEVAPVQPAPVPYHPAPVQPALVQQVSLETAPVQPAPYHPAPFNPTPVQPAPVVETVPVPYHPAPVQPAPVQPVVESYQPIPVQPAPVVETVPAPYNPAPVQPAPVQPVVESYQPAPAQPAPVVETVPAQPAPVVETVPEQTHIVTETKVIAEEDQIEATGGSDYDQPTHVATNEQATVNELLANLDTVTVPNNLDFNQVTVEPNQNTPAVIVQTDGDDYDAPLNEDRKDVPTPEPTVAIVEQPVPQPVVPEESAPIIPQPVQPLPDTYPVNPHQPEVHLQPLAPAVRVDLTTAEPVAVAAVTPNFESPVEVHEVVTPQVPLQPEPAIIQTITEQPIAEVKVEVLPTTTEEAVSQFFENITSREDVTDGPDALQPEQPEQPAPAPAPVAEEETSAENKLPSTDTDVVPNLGEYGSKFAKVQGTETKQVSQPIEIETIENANPYGRKYWIF